MLITDEGEAANRILQQIVDSNTLLKLPLKSYVGRKDRLHVLLAFSSILVRLSEAKMVLVPDDEDGVAFLTNVMSILKFCSDDQFSVSVSLEGSIAAFFSNLLTGTVSNSLKKVLDDGQEICLSLRKFLSHQCKQINLEAAENLCDLISTGKVCHLLHCLLEYNPDLVELKNSWVGDNLAAELVRLFECQTLDLAKKREANRAIPSKGGLEDRDALQTTDQCTRLCSILGILSIVSPSQSVDSDTDSALARCLTLLGKGLCKEGQEMNNLLTSHDVEVLLKKAASLQQLPNWGETNGTLASITKNHSESGVKGAADVEALLAEIGTLRVEADKARRHAEIEKKELQEQAEESKKHAAEAMHELGQLQVQVVEIQLSNLQLVEALKAADLLRNRLEQTCEDQAKMLEGKDKEIEMLTAGRPPEEQFIEAVKVQSTDADSVIGPKELTGHSNTVNSVSCSPDGTLIASGSDDHSVRIWFLALGTCKMVLQGHSNTVYSVAFSPDGSKLASGSYDKTIRIWCLSSSTCWKILEGHNDYVLTVAYSPDGSSLVSGSLDGFIYIWSSSTTEKNSKVYEGRCNGGVYSVKYAPDGRCIASGSYDKTICIWAMSSSGLVARELRGHTRQVLSVAFSLDGILLASGSWDNTVRIWSVPEGDCIRVLQGHSKAVMTVAFSANGTLASGSRDRSVRIWSPLSGECLRVFDEHKSFVLSVAFERDGKYLASGSSDRSILVWVP